MTTTCTACNGTGTRPEFFHVEYGRCFKCGGTGDAARWAADRRADADRRAEVAAAIAALPGEDDLRLALVAAGMRPLRARSAARLMRYRAIDAATGESHPADDPRSTDLLAEADALIGA